MATVTDRALTGGTAPGARPSAPLGTDTPEEPPPGRSRKKLLVRGAALLVAVLVAGVGGFIMLTGGAGADEEAAAEAEAEPEPGAVVPLDAITVNLADGRYLQVGIALQEADLGGAHEELDGSQALDIVIGQLSGRPMADLVSPEQREAVKADLVAEISDAYHDHVYDIYFTSFVMQ